MYIIIPPDGTREGGGKSKGKVIFGGQNIRGSEIFRHFVGNIFVIRACTAGKGRQGHFIRG